LASFAATERAIFAFVSADSLSVISVGFIFSGLSPFFTDPLQICSVLRVFSSKETRSGGGFWYSGARISLET